MFVNFKLVFNACHWLFFNAKKNPILKSYPWWEHDCKQCIIVIRWRWDWLGVKVMVFNTTFSKIPVTSWRSVLLVKETGVPGEDHRPYVSHWQTLSPIVVLSTSTPWSGFELTTLVVICTDCTGSCKSNDIYFVLDQRDEFFFYSGISPKQNTDKQFPPLENLD